MDNLPCYNFKRGKHDIRIYSLQKKMVVLFGLSVRYIMLCFAARLL